MKIKKIVGFTLAEVLITLGVIGVVAAISIPSLIKEYRKMTYLTSFKKSYVDVQTGMRNYMADKGCTDIACTGLFNGQSDDVVWKNRIISELPNIFKSVTIFASDDSSLLDLPASFLGGAGNASEVYLSDKIVAFKLINGAFVNLSDMDPGNCDAEIVPSVGVCAMVMIDFNGTKPPNAFGKDLFQLFLTKSGQLEAYGARNISSTEASSWVGDHTLCGDPANSSIDSSVTGFGCGARIIEQGWQINYDINTPPVQEGPSA